MKRRIGILVICLMLIGLPLIGYGQVSTLPQRWAYPIIPRQLPRPPTIMSRGAILALPASVSLSQSWETSGLQLRDQWNASERQQVTQWGLTLPLDTIRLCFTMTPTSRLKNTVSVSGNWLLGQTDFGSTDQKDKPKEVRTEASWSSQRIEAEFLALAVLRPLIVLEHFSSSITATGEKDSKAITDSESWNRWLWGVGGAMEYRSGMVLCNGRAAASDRLVFARGEISIPCTTGVYVSGSYQYEKRNLGDFISINHGPGIGLSVRF